MTSFFHHKKIAAYIALPHHTRFITPVMEKLEKLGATVQYIVGQAERSQEITAITQHLNYAHVFDYISSADEDEINTSYRRIRDGFVQGIKKDIAIGAASVLTVLDKTLYATAKEYIGFRNFLSREKPDLCFALHEVNRWGKMFSFWAKQMNIPFITLQEGLANASDFLFIGHVQYSTLNLVWGEKTRKKLISYEAPRDRVIPVGNTHIANEIKRINQKNIRQTKKRQLGLKKIQTILLFFSAEPSPVEELEPIFEFFGHTESAGKKLIIKFHPVTTKLIIEKWIADIPKPQADKFIFIHGEENTYDLIAISDLCIISEPSTIGLETIAIGRPLVQLKLARPDQYPYDFVENRVAHQLTPIELIQQLKSMTDFSTFVNPDAVEQFIRDELTDTANAIDRIVTLMQHTIQSNQETCLSEFIYAHDTSTEDMTWSIILPVPDNPDLFLVTLEAISSNCDGYGRFEVILVRPQTVPAGIQTILNSLEGDIKIVTVEDHTGLAQQLNQGAAESQGAYLLFLDTQIAPDKDWMESLSHETQTSTSPKIFGARVVNRHGNIVHAGMVLDSNNSPVSAYLHLDAGFPHANKKRCFQMVDYFAGLHRDVFQTLDGFNPKTGQYLFLDLCLRGNQQGIHSLYLPKVHLVQLENTMNKKKSDPDAALYFYSRWHGSLWENEQQLYESDGVSQLQLDAARMTRAMEVAGR